jgi:hypothetical protein
MLHSGEKLYPVPTAVEKATGQRPHPTTTHRWRLRGINNVRLKTVKYGGRRMASVESVVRFLEAVTQATDGESVTSTSRTNRRRQTDFKRAECKLDQAGI